jgi:hypothetical protein
VAHALATATQVVMLSASALLAIGLVHKLWLLGNAEGEGGLVGFLARNGIKPRLALSSASLAEGAVIALIYLAPVVGLGALAVLLSGYSALLARFPEAEDCGCFGEVMPATSRDAIVRNVTLSIAAACGAGVAVVDDVRTHLFSQLPIGVSLIVLAALIGLANASRVLSPVAQTLRR